MSFKPGQWVVVDTTISYWPASAKNNKGPFRIQNVMDGLNDSYAVFPLGTPNNAYFKDLTLYKPQVGDKVKILKPMYGFVEHPNILKDQTGKIGIITNIQSLGGEKNISIQCEDESYGWWYMDEENVHYELVEPKGSINTAAPEPPSTPVVKPTKRVLNGNV